MRETMEVPREASVPGEETGFFPFSHELNPQKHGTVTEVPR
jgi:hypothetical protein